MKTLKQKILEAIEEKQGIGQGDIAERTGAKANSVNTYLAGLKNDELLVQSVGYNKYDLTQLGREWLQQQRSKQKEFQMKISNAVSISKSMAKPATDSNTVTIRFQGIDFSVSTNKTKIKIIEDLMEVRKKLQAQEK